MATLPFSVVFGLALGFYDGFFGPGTGSFWTAALIANGPGSLRESNRLRIPYVSPRSSRSLLLSRDVNWPPRM